MIRILVVGIALLLTKVAVAAALAQRLQLNRIYPIDDHLDKDMYAPVENGYLYFNS